MNETAHGVRGSEPQEPQDDQNDSDGVEHGGLSFPLLNVHTLTNYDLTATATTTDIVRVERRNEIIGKATVNLFRCMCACAQSVLEYEGMIPRVASQHPPPARLHGNLTRPWISQGNAKELDMETQAGKFPPVLLWTAGVALMPQRTSELSTQEMT